MGRIRNWLRNHGDDIAIGSILSLAAAGIGAGVVIAYLQSRPEGAQIKAKADGTVTAEEEISYGEYFKNGTGDAYNEEIAGIVNDYDRFLVNELGWNRSLIDEDLHLAIESHDAVCDDCNISKWYSGCYKSSNSTIYLTTGNPLGLFEGIQHEIGHSVRSMPRDNNYLKELPSQSNEFYAYFRLNSLNRTLGTYYAEKNIPTGMEYVSAECKLDNKEVPYMLGAIGFLVQANKEGGNLERAMHNVINAAESQLEKDTREAVSGYDNMCMAYIGEYEKLLQQPGLIAGLEKQMSAEEAEKFIELLRTKIPEIK